MSRPQQSTTINISSRSRIGISIDPNVNDVAQLALPLNINTVSVGEWNRAVGIMKDYFRIRFTGVDVVIRLVECTMSTYNKDFYTNVVGIQPNPAGSASVFNPAGTQYFDKVNMLARVSCATDNYMSSIQLPINTNWPRVAANVRFLKKGKMTTIVRYRPPRSLTKGSALFSSNNIFTGGTVPLASPLLFTQANLTGTLSTVSSSIFSNLICPQNLFMQVDSVPPPSGLAATSNIATVSFEVYTSWHFIGMGQDIVL